jgi:arylsulfatase A-like enzyme
MKHPIILPALLSLVALSSAAPAPGTTRPPNILLLFVDDLGYADLGCQGSKEVLTPHIDSIAKDGVRCTAGYATAPMCSPSRAGLVTGRYQQRFGHELNLGPVYTVKAGLPVSEQMLPKRLKPYGYVSGVIGKWDLGSRDPYHPLARGFDEFFGFLGGSRSHHPKVQKTDFNVLRRNHERLPRETGYSSDIYSDEAVAFIERHKEKPFFLYVSYTAPHWPMEAKSANLERFAHVEDLHRRTFLAMMTALDAGVGRILETLQRCELDERTLVLFVSDNGGPTGRPRKAPDARFQFGQNTSLNTPFRGVKGQLYEGGIRVPFLARWTGKLPANTTCDVPVSTLDIAVTAVALAGGDDKARDGLDGVNLVPILREGKAGSRPLFWRVGGNRAIRRDDWKLLLLPNQPPQLFNLQSDPGESRNLTKSEPERFDHLRKELAHWQRELRPPLWNPAKAGTAKGKGQPRSGAPR